MADVIRLGGFSGGGKLDGATILVTSGSVTSGVTPAYLEMTALPKEGMAGRVIHADGVARHEASLGFELYSGSSGAISTLFDRGTTHSFEMSDGYNGVSGTEGYVTSATIQAASGGIISGSVSLVFKKEFSYSASSNTYLGSEIPLGYWISGGGKISDWSLSMSQDAQPMYGNTDDTDPHYIKIGTVSYELSVTSYEQVAKEASGTAKTTTINIGVGEKTIIGTISETGYNFGGTSGLGTFTYKFSSGSNDGKSGTLVIQ